MNSIIFFAHRGASGYEPENTLLAILKAIILGADWIEIDMCAIVGQLIVIHDERMGRTTNVSGYVMEKSPAYLHSLDAGKRQQIPLLQEVFALVNGRTGINIELKGPDTVGLTVSLINAYVMDRG